MFADPLDAETFPQQLERLLPSSLRWLEGKGFIRRSVIDGEPLLEITDAGHRYFAGKRGSNATEENLY